jgi:adenine phosphoribosyltransferase
MSKKVPQLAFDIDNHLDKIQDFPIPGILFYDISSLIGNSEAWMKTIDNLAMSIQDLNPEILFGIESRGFLIAGSLATKLGIGMQMIRKKGKLPGKTISLTYDLEYGQDALEIQENAVKRGQRVVVVDDILATGGTMGAAISLLENAGANIVTGCCIIELSFLNGRANVPTPFQSLISY